MRYTPAARARAGRVFTVGAVASIAAACALGSGALARVARAGDAGDAGDASDLRALLTCDRVADPGRVRCEVEARVEPGESIAWGDVVLLRVPPFATALRGRIGAHDASVREPGLWRWSFAVVARAKGAGDLSGRVRVVVCRGSSCAVREVEVAVRVEVG
jgi:hypothetical protein